jgi:hypothetical protein
VESRGFCIWRDSEVRISFLSWCVWQETVFSLCEDMLTMYFIKKFYKLFTFSAICKDSATKTVLFFKTERFIR